MAVTTIGAHVNRALDFFNKPDTYFAIGKTSAWSGDDMNPPNPDTGSKSLNEVIGYKKVESVFMVRPVLEGETGDINYRDESWKIVPVENALAQDARWVYIKSVIRYDELPLGFYRQVGVYTGLKRKSGISSNKYNLLPSEVENAGVLEVIDNRQPSNRQIDQTETLSLVLEF